MFETATLDYGPATKRVWATCAGFTGQALLIGCALLAPMVWPQVIPRVALVTSLAPPGQPPGKSKAEPQRAEPQRTRVVREFRDFPTAPPTVPDKVMLVDETALIASNASSARETSGWVIGGADPNALLRRSLAADTAEEVRRLPVKPKPPEPTVAEAAPVVKAAPPRISVLELARPIHRVEPIYPRLAVIGRVQGTVKLLGVLGTDGRIRELQVLSGHYLLVNAAVEAVRQWVYAPTLLNGQPVEVQAPIEVNFILSR